MIRVMLSIWLAMALSTPACAGAWLREKGKGFLAYSNLTTNYLDATYSAYLDYGLRDDLTLGATLDVYALRNGYIFGQGHVFMRKPLDWGGDKANWAYEIGIGARHTGLEFVPIAKTTLSFGTGIKWGDRQGWVAIDSGVEWDLKYAQHVYKVDTTLGMELGKRSKGMIQIFAARGRNFTNVTISPNYIYQRKKKKTNYVAGLEFNTLTPDIVGIKFGVWQSF